MLDLSSKMDGLGTLRWDIPEGEWIVLRFGYTYSGNVVCYHSGAISPRTLDYLSADDLRWYWKKVIEPLIADVGSAAGRVLKYVWTDSWECGGMNWTPTFREEFRRRRGYDLPRFLPVLAGRSSTAVNCPTASWPITGRRSATASRPTIIG